MFTRVNLRRSVSKLVAPFSLAVVLILLFNSHSSTDLVQVAQSIAARIVKEGVPLGLLAVGAGLVIAAGYVDLSVTGVATAAGGIFATLNQLGISPYLSALIAGIFGLLSGTMLSTMILRFSSPALIMSWAVGVLWMIATVVFSGAKIVDSGVTSIYLGVELPPTFWSFGGDGFLLSLIILLVSYLILKYSKLPRYAEAVGSNSQSAFYSGVRINRVVTLCYVANGGLAALAGIAWTLLISSAATTDHVGKELMIIAIAVFGGTAMRGGYLTLESVICGAFFWAGAKTWIDGLNLESIGNLQQHAANALFALVFIFVLILFGSNLDQFRQTIQVKQTKKNPL
jgi:ribose/xylose/arabinose/galactoside ABC-type transport system permease subunit